MTFDENYLLLKNDVENEMANMSLEELEFLLTRAKHVFEEYDELQKVVKGNANSIYGSTGNAFFSMRDYDIATDITMGAKHFAIVADLAINGMFSTWADNPQNLKRIQEFYPDVKELINLDYKRDVPDYDVCVYGDTDSRYVELDLIYKLLSKELPEDDKELIDFSIFLNKHFLSEVIKNAIEEDCDFRSARKGYLKMDHEVTTRKCTLIKKKKYILTLIYKDGKILNEPEFKFVGVELKRGATSPDMKRILNVLVNKYLIQGYSIEEIRIETLKLIKYLKQVKVKNNIYLITSVSGFKNIKQLEDGTYVSDKNHIQMQIALSWMNFITENNLLEEYRFPFEGQRMKYYYPVDRHKYKVIGVPDDVIDLDSVPGLPEPDWNRMLRASFIKPLLRYISDIDDVDDKDCDNFLLGFTKKLSF